MIENYFSELEGLLVEIEEYVVEGKLNKNKVAELAHKYDAELIDLLAGSGAMRKMFFVETKKNVLVFNKDKFIQFISNKEFLPDSFTTYKNKIGLAQGTELLSEKKEVVLNWAYKDCILEGGQDAEDTKREEVFHNEVLAPDQIDRLLDEKVLVGFKRYDKSGEHSINAIDENDNLLIRGNNLLVLHSILKRYRGSVKLIYIDPPYNKDNDSFYNDSFKRSTWLTFMKNRLEVAWELLADTGLLLVQIDITQQHYLGTLLDEVTKSKPQAFVSVKVKSPSGDSSKAQKYLEDVTEYIYVYSKNPTVRNLKPVTIKEIVDRDSKTAQQYHFELENAGTVGSKAFEFQIGNQGKRETIEVFNLDALAINNIPTKERTAERYVQSYEIICRTAKFSGEFLKQFGGKKGNYYFKYTPTRGKNAGIETETIVINGEGLIYLKDFAEVIESDGDTVVAKIEKATNFIDDISWQGIAQEGGVKLTKGKKPEELLRRIIEWSTEPGELVIDYHLGSGTTAAVAHKMGRKYIGIEQLEYGDNDALVRLKNVIGGDTTGVSKKIGWSGGGSFIYCHIMDLGNKFIEKVKHATTDKELTKLLEQAKKSSFLSYKIDPEKINPGDKEFADLSIAHKKQLLLELVDHNHLYVNYSEIDDNDYGVSVEDKKLNKQFYGN